MTDVCKYKIGQKVQTTHGPGKVVRIEYFNSLFDSCHYADTQDEVPPEQTKYRYGVRHYEFPKKFESSNPKDGILFYSGSDIQVEADNA